MPDGPAQNGQPELEAASEPAAARRLKQALLAHVRQDFSAPVAMIVGYAEILVEDAPRHGLHRFVPDIERIHQAGLALKRLIDGLLDPETLGDRAGSAEFAEFSNKLRHDLRTPLNAIKGYGEMLLEDAQEANAEASAEDIGKVLDAVMRLLERIDALVEFSKGTAALPTQSPGQPSSAIIDLIRPLPEVGPAAKQVGSSRILVVDDHQSNRDLLSRRLTREGHEVTTAANGEEALKLVQQTPFDLILLDLLMPGMSGYEVLCRLKSDPRQQDIPVIVISALDEISTVVGCIEAGAEDYMPKSFDPVLLRARVNSCLERKHLRDREKLILDELRNEKEKSELLLLNILPSQIVTRLRLGETVIADRIADATILFADMVGFTGLAARVSAARLVDLLNGLFTQFDRLTEQFGLEKIKTIGDAYMVAGGVLQPRPDHAAAVAEMALAILEAVEHTGRQFGQPLQVRVGVHTGPVVAGVIGTRRCIFDVWGETVNIASRLESNGTAGEITVSAECYRRLQDAFEFGPGRTLALGGSGRIKAFSLYGRRALPRDAMADSPTVPYG